LSETDFGLGCLGNKSDGDVIFLKITIVEARTEFAEPDVIATRQSLPANKSITINLMKNLKK
jgi:hypothetical protein